VAARASLGARVATQGAHAIQAALRGSAGDPASTAVPWVTAQIDASGVAKGIGAARVAWGARARCPPLSAHASSGGASIRRLYRTLVVASSAVITVFLKIRTVVWLSVYPRRAAERTTDPCAAPHERAASAFAELAAVPEAIRAAAVALAAVHGVEAEVDACSPTIITHAAL